MQDQTLIEAADAGITSFLDDQRDQGRIAGTYYDDAVAWMDEHSPNDPRLILLRAEATELMGVRP